VRKALVFALSRADDTEMDPILAAAVACFRENIRKLQCVAMEELVTCALQLLQLPEVQRWAHYQVQYLLVDEVQDTDLQQVELLRKLCCGHERITAVGDDDQSIYGWRAHQTGSEAFRGLRSKFPGYIATALTTNYRSSGAIVEAATRLVCHNTDREPRELRSARPYGRQVRFHILRSLVAECQAIRDELVKLHEDAAAPWSTMAVVVRTNKEAKSVSAQLQQGGVPTASAQKRPAILRSRLGIDLLAVCRMVLDPGCDLAFGRTAKALGVSLAVLRRLGCPTGTVAVLKGIDDPVDVDIEEPEWSGCAAAAERACRVSSVSPAAKEKLQHFFLQIPKIRQHLQERSWSAGACVMHIAAELLPSHEKQAVALAVDAAVYDMHPKSLLNLQEWLRDCSRGVFDSGGEEAVTVCTIHACKGLEWDTVVLARANDGILPIASDGPGLLEERRLCYVAMTRAKNNLIVTCNLAGDGREREPSRFVEEAGIAGSAAAQGSNHQQGQSNPGVVAPRVPILTGFCSAAEFAKVSLPPVL